MSGNEDKSKSVVAGRMGVGYGYDLPYTVGYTSKESGVSRQFNLTGMLTYSTSQKVSAASKLVDNVGLLFQPGYYLPLKSTPVLIYGTVGYARALFRQRERISVDGLQILPNTRGVEATYRTIPLRGGSVRTNGLILGVGAKHAITSRLYAGFDYTHTEYDYKDNGQLLRWDDPDAKSASGSKPSELGANTDWHSKKLRTDTFLLTVGFRFF